MEKNITETSAKERIRAFCKEGHYFYFNGCSAPIEFIEFGTRNLMTIISKKGTNTGSALKEINDQRGGAYSIEKEIPWKEEDHMFRWPSVFLKGSLICIEEPTDDETVYNLYILLKLKNDGKYFGFKTKKCYIQTEE